MKNHTVEHYDCGCWYELVEHDGEVLVLRMQTCPTCMSLAWLKLDSLWRESNSQLELTDRLSVSAHEEAINDHSAP